MFPGCDAPINWCDNHHVISWSDGGRTTIDNTAALCRFHHAITHLPGWTMHATDTQWFWWTTPKGITLHSQRHHTPPPGAPPGAPPDT
ncbi:MAG: HNH endonuclease signature motif containing protein [Microthrixaceae bacterium]